jgi:hypothetical protein
VVCLGKFPRFHALRGDHARCTLRTTNTIWRNKSKPSLGARMRIERDGASAVQHGRNESTAEPKTTGSRRAALGGVAGGLGLAASGLLLPGRLVEDGVAADRPAGRRQGRKGQQQAQDICINCWHRVRWVNIENRIPNVYFQVEYGYFYADQIGGKWELQAIQYNIGQMSLDESRSAEYVCLRRQGGFRQPPGKAYLFSIGHTSGFGWQNRIGWLTLGTGGEIIEKKYGWHDEPPFTGKIVVKNHELHEFGYYDWRIDDYWFRVQRLADDPNVARGGYQVSLVVQRP